MVVVVVEGGGWGGFLFFFFSFFFFPFGSYLHSISFLRRVKLVATEKERNGKTLQQKQNQIQNKNGSAGGRAPPGGREVQTASLPELCNCGTVRSPSNCSGSLARSLVMSTLHEYFTFLSCFGCSP